MAKLKVDMGDLKEEKEIKVDHKNTGGGGDFTGKLRSFGGDEAVFQEFLERYIIISNAYEWDDKIICKRFPLFLSGSALDFFINLPDNTKGKWDDLKAAFKRQYVTPETSKIFGREFRTRKQGVNERVEVYAHDIKKFAKMAYPLFTALQLDGILTDQFVLGLSKELRSALWDKEFDTFDSAVSKARSMEYRKELLLSVDSPVSLGVIREPVFKRDNVHPGLINNREIINSGGEYYCSFCNKYGHLLKSCRVLAEQTTRDFLRNNNADVICFRCGVKGHRKEQCTYNNQRISEQTRRTITCYKCGKEGHIARDCRTKESIPRKREEEHNRDGWQSKGWANKNSYMVREEEGSTQRRNSELELELLELRKQNERMRARQDDYQVRICVEVKKVEKRNPGVTQGESSIQSPILIEEDKIRPNIFEFLDKAMKQGQQETRQCLFGSRLRKNSCKHRQMVG